MLVSLGVLPLRLGHMLLDRALGRVVMHFNRRLGAIEGALDGRMNTMMMKSVAMRRV